MKTKETLRDEYESAVADADAAHRRAVTRAYVEYEKGLGELKLNSEYPQRAFVTERGRAARSGMVVTSKKRYG